VCNKSFCLRARARTHTHTQSTVSRCIFMVEKPVPQNSNFQLVSITNFPTDAYGINKIMLVYRLCLLNKSDMC
jgi:hypothetical protein